VGGGERQVDVARLPDRLAAVQRLEHCELARALLEDAGDPEEVLRPLGAGQARPGGVRLARRRHRERHVLRPRLRHLRERLLVARREGCERLTRARLEPLAADEEAVALGERHDLPGLGRRRVRPLARHRRAPAATLELSHS
jgi:hypothetical protein